jgi:hypothetical protein
MCWFFDQIKVHELNSNDAASDFSTGFDNYWTWDAWSVSLAKQLTERYFDSCCGDNCFGFAFVGCYCYETQSIAYVRNFRRV